MDTIQLGKLHFAFGAELLDRRVCVGALREVDNMDGERIERTNSSRIETAEDFLGSFGTYFGLEFHEDTAGNVRRYSRGGLRQSGDNQQCRKAHYSEDTPLLRRH
ncbi:MAG TPA: hypothetical protein VFL57_19805 [Bryobacteraceae bacterium]|nr:hypothetical protein [Bryobacteraceae bacterium]